MAKQRPTLGTFASPVGSMVTPRMEQVAPIDEKAIRDTYAFAEAFGDLSQSMAELGSVIQAQKNKENLEAGSRLVATSQRTYAELEKEGKIRPAENPWQAIGASRASGILEASRSEVELRALISQEADKNPAFYDDPVHFDALVSSYAQNKTQQYGSNSYLTDAFFENFNPVVVRLQRDNFDAIEENRFSKVLAAANSKVQSGVAAISDLMGPKMSRNINPELDNIQRTFDEQVGLSGGKAGDITRAYGVALIEIMRSNPEQADQAELVLKSLKTGTGKLYDTSLVQNLLVKYQQEIAANKDKATSAELRAIFDKKRELLDNYGRGFYGTGPEAHTKLVDDFDAWADSGAIDVGAGKTDEERDFLFSRANQMDAASAKAREDALKEAADLDEQQEAQLKLQREERANGMMLALREALRSGETSVENALDGMKTMLADPKNGYTFEERLKFSKSAEEDFKGRAGEYENAVALKKTENAENRIAQTAASQIGAFVKDVLTNPQSIARPLDIGSFALEADRQWRGAGLNEEQRNKANDRMYFMMGEATQRGLDALLLNPPAQGGIAPAPLTDLKPSPNDTPDVRTYKSNARAIQYDANLSLDEAFDQEDTIAFFKNVASTMLNAETIERGVPPEVEDLYRLWVSSKSGYFRENMFSTPAGQRLDKLFAQVQVLQERMSLQDALADAVSTYQGTMGSSLLDWTKLGTVEAGDRVKFESQLRSFISKRGIVHPDSRRLLEGLYGAEVLRIFNSSADNPLNLSKAIAEAGGSVDERIVAFGGSFMFKQGNIGRGSYTSEHFRNLAKFYAPSAEEPVFFPVSRQANGEYVYALRDKDGNIVQDRLFTVSDLSSGDSLDRAVYYEKTGKSESDWARSKNLKFVDYSATFEARNQRLRALLQPVSEAQ